MNNEQVVKALEALINTAYGEDTKAKIRELTGRTRIVAHGEATTMEFDLDRVHIVTNDSGLIQGFRFG